MIFSKTINYFPEHPGLFTSRGCCKCEAWFMKLWFTTASGPQQSRCGEIGSPEGEKMATYDYQLSLKVFMYGSRQIL